jgi:guanylate kinase
MKTIIFILGKTGSGKTTITNKLVEELDIKRIKLDTDRPRRDGEDDSEYRFLENMKCYEYEYFEKRTYNTTNGEWNYATHKSELDDGSLFIVQGPVDMYENYRKYCLENNIRLLPIYIKVDEYDRINHLINRENEKQNPDWVELFRREYEDEKQFKNLNIIANNLYTVDHKYDINNTVGIIKCYIFMIEYTSNTRGNIILDYDIKPSKGIPVNYIDTIRQLVKDEIKKALEEYDKSKSNIECGDSYICKDLDELSRTAKLMKNTLDDRYNNTYKKLVDETVENLHIEADKLRHKTSTNIYESEYNLKETDRILDDYRRRVYTERFTKQQDYNLLNVPEIKNEVELIGVDVASDDSSKTFLNLQEINVTNVQNVTDSHIIVTLSIDKGKISKKNLDLLMKKYKES